MHPILHGVEILTKGKWSLKRENRDKKSRNCINNGVYFCMNLLRVENTKTGLKKKREKENEASVKVL